MQENTYSPYAEHADLDAFGGAAAPQYVFALGTDSLANGSYDCEIVAAVLDRRGEHKVLVAMLHLLSHDRRQIEHVWWLNRQESVNAFLADAAALGFPAQSWGAGEGKTPLSTAIPAAVLQLKGVRFRGSKTSREVPEKPAMHGQAAQKARTFHDFRVAGRLGTFHEAPAPAATRPTPAPTPAPAPAPSLSDDIPF